MKKFILTAFVFSVGLHCNIIVRSIIPDGKDTLRRCNVTEQVYEVEGTQGYFSEGNSSCYRSKLILKDYTSNGGQIAIIRFHCSTSYAVRLPAGRRCRSRYDSAGCYLYVANNSLADCESRLNVTGCRTVLITENSSMQISFKQLGQRRITFSVEFTLIRCSETYGEESRIVSAGRSFNISSVGDNRVTQTIEIADRDTATSTNDESTHAQSVSKGRSVEIPLSIVAATLLLAFGIGFGYAYRRKKRTSAKSDSNKLNKVTDENGACRYNETSTTPTMLVAYENSDTALMDNSRVMTSPNESFYVEPESAPSSSSTKLNEGKTSDEPKYTNSQPSNVTYYEPVENSGDGYLKPIQREFVDGESGYQYPVKKSVSDCGYLQLQYSDKS